MNKKSQAAIEFLSTYGWAMVMIVILGSAVTYYAFDVTNQAPNVCTIGDTTCSAYALTEKQDYSGTLEFEGSVYTGVYGRIEIDTPNLEADTIEIINIEFKHDEVNLLADCNSISKVGAGRTIELRCNICKDDGDECISFLGSKDKDKLGIDISYTMEGKMFTKHIKGEIIFKVTNVVPYTLQCDDGEDNDNDGETDISDQACICTPQELEGVYEVERDVCSLFDNCNNNEDCKDNLICDSESECKINIHGDCSAISFPSECMAGTSCENDKCLGSLNYNPCDPDSVFPGDCISTLICDPQTETCIGDNYCELNTECLIAGQSCINNECKDKSNLKGECDKKDDNDCNDLLVCDSYSNTCLGDVGYTPCNGQAEYCSEDFICPEDTCIKPAVKPDWCMNEVIMHWDPVNSYCWVFEQGVTNYDCNEICDIGNLDCVDNNWNDEDCTILEEFIECTKCKSSWEPFAPNYKSGECNERRSFVPQLCSTTRVGTTRLCLCEKR